MLLVCLGGQREARSFEGKIKLFLRCQTEKKHPRAKKLLEMPVAVWTFDSKRMHPNHKKTMGEEPSTIALPPTRSPVFSSRLFFPVYGESPFSRTKYACTALRMYDWRSHQLPFMQMLAALSEQGGKQEHSDRNFSKKM